MSNFPCGSVSASAYPAVVLRMPCLPIQAVVCMHICAYLVVCVHICTYSTWLGTV
ncbi:hypothetical protein C8Q73DRAFT_714015, partial [Cubamyces lactineus]